MPRTGKTFRVFVSSTFTDLERERNVLQSEVFPRLRDLCAEHDCRFQGIDLRWGVREEAGLDQRTMRICLEELERCQATTPRPNFIVLLGDRYGWQPLPSEIDVGEFERLAAAAGSEGDRGLLSTWYLRDDNAVPPVYCLQPRTGKFVERRQWEDVERRLRGALLGASRLAGMEPEKAREYLISATEREIRSGALSIADAAEHVFCFFREFEVPPRGPGAAGFVDTDASGEILDEAGDLLSDLKKRLREKLPGHFFTYPATWSVDGPTTDHLQQLTRDVYESLSGVILAEVARLVQLDDLDREIADQRSFGRERSRFFTGREQLLEVISECIEGTDPHPLCIWGEGGSGKTALCARAIAGAEERPDPEVVFRFVGATPDSFDVRVLLAGLCRQISLLYGVEEETVPASYERLVRELPVRLALATPQRPLVVFIDSLDQLSGSDDPSLLTWLPPVLPAGVRVIVTTRPGPALVTVRRMVPEGSVMQLKPMSAAEGEALLSRWLEDASRTLGPAQEEVVLRRFAANGNPLYLKLALEEALRWHSYTGEVSLAPDIEGMIGDLFARLSEDANHGAVLVSRSLGYLAASRDGLSEDELMDILSADGEVYEDFLQRARHTPPEPRLPVAVWSRLYYDLAPYLAERRAGECILLTFYHRELGDATREHYLAGGDEQRRHLSLSDYFDAQGLGTRKIKELPWQLFKAGAWKRLYDLLADLEFFRAAWERDEYEVRSYWASVESNAPLRAADAYGHLCRTSPDYPAELVWEVAQLLMNLGNTAQSLALREYLVEHYRATGEEEQFAASLENLAAVYLELDQLDRALELSREAEAVFRRLGDETGVADSLGPQALVMKLNGDLDGALALHREEQELFDRMAVPAGVQRSLGNQAGILITRGDLEGAMALLREQERICREAGIRDGLATALGNQALIHRMRGDPDAAMELHQEEESIFEEVGNKEGLASSYLQQGNLEYTRGNLDRAQELFEEMRRVSSELGRDEDRAASLGGLALVLEARGDLDGAMGLHREEERLYRHLGFREHLAVSLGNQGVILRKQGDLDCAMALHREEEGICREIDSPGQLQRSLCNQGAILYMRGEPDSAMELYRQQEDICWRLGDKKWLAISLRDQANVLFDRGDLDGALELYTKAEALFRKVGNKTGLVSVLAPMVLILYSRGEHDAVMELVLEKETLCRELRDAEGLARSLCEHASLLAGGKRWGEALPVAEEALGVARQHDFDELAENTREVLDLIRANLGH